MDFDAEMRAPGKKSGACHINQEQHFFFSGQKFEDQTGEL
jgi:hypothetical protein